jgi:hypothetical protein
VESALVLFTGEAGRAPEGQAAISRREYGRCRLGSS